MIAIVFAWFLICLCLQLIKRLKNLPFYLVLFCSPALFDLLLYPAFKCFKIDDDFYSFHDSEIQCYKGDHLIMLIVYTVLALGFLSSLFFLALKTLKS